MGMKIEAATRLQATVTDAQVLAAIKGLKALSIKTSKVPAGVNTKIGEGEWDNLDTVHLEVNGDANAALTSLRRIYGSQPMKQRLKDGRTVYVWSGPSILNIFESLAIFIPKDPATEMTMIYLVVPS